VVSVIIQYMESLLSLFSFAFGAIIGSFLNVVIFRFNTGKTIGGRSCCASCGRTLSWFELIPLFSFISLGGKCRKCKSSISSQYILVEFFTGLLFLLVALKELSFFSDLSPESVLGVVVGWLVVAILMVVFFYDLKHMIIPDSLSQTLFLVAVGNFVLNLFLFNAGVGYAYAHLTSALIFAGFLGLLWLISGGRWIGLGDAKLATSLGLLLPLSSGLSALAFAFWIGASVALVKIAHTRLSESQKRITMKTEIPFAPFLIAGFILSYFMQSDIFHISNLFL